MLYAHTYLPPWIGRYTIIVTDHVSFVIIETDVVHHIYNRLIDPLRSFTHVYASQ